MTASNTAGKAGRFSLDAGPAFNAEGRPQADPADLAEPLDAQVEAAGQELWEPTVVKNLLRAQGSLLHGLIAVDKESQEWRHTDADLEAIGAPLTRMLNRYDVTRAGAAAGDEMGLGLALLGYASRSIGERRDAIAAVRALEPEPITGWAAPEGSGAPDQERAHDYDDSPTPPSLSGRRR